MVESRTVRGPSARLHGRDPECASLDALLADVRGGHSSVLLLRGEPGIGKSALLQYLVERGSGLTLLRCAGVQSQMELAFSGLYELCSPILDGLDSLPTPQSDALGIALGLTAGESPDKFLVALGALGLLSAASEHGPVICIVEDGHWLDQASAQVLGFVGRRLLAEPVGMVIAARAPVAAPDHLVGLPELRIAGVDGHAARALLDSVGGMRVDDSILARIIDETHGNPLALLELGARMMAAGSAGGFEAVDAASLTNRIEDEYLAQLNALPRDTQQLVLLASADPVCDTALIQRAAGQLGLGVDAVDATWLADGYVAGASTLKEAIRQHLNDSPDPDFVGFAFKVMAINLGDDDAWFSMITGQAKLARERGMLSWVPFTVDGPAEFAVHSGNLAEGEVLLLEAGLIDPTTTAATTPRLALLVAAWRGDAAAAEKPLRMLTKAAATQGHGFLLAYADYAKSVLYNGLGDYPSAADVAESASADALDCVPFPVFTLPELVEAAAYSDQPERARVASEQLTEVAIASGSDFARGKAAHARALVTDGESADAPYQEAIELLSKTRMAIHVARARLGYGRWLRSMNRRTDARAQLRSAHESFVAMGAAAFAAQARRELRATGERVRRRSGSTNAELTPQEEQIAQLARDRRTNPEIGAQLFLSARTVEWHLRKIFGKLEITSRRELDAALTRRGRL